MNALRFALSLGIFVSTSVSARDWTDEDLIQDITFSCELLSQRGTVQERLARTEQKGRGVRLKGSLTADALLDGLRYAGTLRVVDDGAYFSVNDAQGEVLSELIWPEFLANDDIWISHEIEPSKSVKWLCSYRTSSGKDLLRLMEIHGLLKLLVQNLDEVAAGVKAYYAPLRRERKAPPITVPEACYRFGVSLMRAQRMADRSNSNSVGWRARGSITELRDRIAIEGVNVCRSNASMEDVARALDRITLAVAYVRGAVAPDTHSSAIMLPVYK